MTILPHFPVSTTLGLTMDMAWGILLVVIGVGAYMLGVRWWRYRRTVKLADKLLSDVIKDKDSFRR
ncbi:MAG: hypothetical protein GKS05_10780 [Nitrospirales bacterium]|nr:hypothetical protein [Nitrospirales bacterium]